MILPDFIDHRPQFQRPQFDIQPVHSLFHTIIQNISPLHLGLPNRPIHRALLPTIMLLLDDDCRRQRRATTLRRAHYISQRKNGDTQTHILGKNPSHMCAECALVCRPVRPTPGRPRLTHPLPTVVRSHASASWRAKIPERSPAPSGV